MTGNNQMPKEYLKTLTILVVEDDVTTCASLERLLGTLVSKVHVANNGIDGLTLFREYSPQLVITDICMPVMDGLTMVQLIRNENRYVPIIITTAFEQSDYLMRAIDIGVDKFVLKPIQIPRLSQALLDCAARLHDQEYIRHIALHDPLTDLPNRTLLKERFDMAVASSRRNKEQLALLFIDLDHFKSINDNFGHSVGDQVLREIATRLITQYRACDTVCRMSGDEFLVVITGVHSRQDVEVAAEKTRVALEYDLSDENAYFLMTASIGIALYPDDGSGMDELIRKADMAMYQVKQQGKNNYAFYSHTHGSDTTSVQKQPE